MGPALTFSLEHHEGEDNEIQCGPQTEIIHCQRTINSYGNISGTPGIPISTVHSGMKKFVKFACRKITGTEIEGYFNG